MPKGDTILCWTTQTKRSDVVRMLNEQDTDGLTHFIKARFLERFVRPLDAIPKEAIHGFCIMAIWCLMIEALECFWEGLPDTLGRGEGKRVFKEFFKRNANLSMFSPTDAEAFYNEVRCGILHQAETYGGWTIQRKGSLFNSATKTINAKKFHDELKQCLDYYCSELEKAKWDDKLWQDFKKKMETVCANCN
jgi:hypothetical protein